MGLFFSLLSSPWATSSWTLFPLPFLLLIKAHNPKRPQAPIPITLSSLRAKPGPNFALALAMGQSPTILLSFVVHHQAQPALYLFLFPLPHHPLKALSNLAKNIRSCPLAFLPLRLTSLPLHIYLPHPPSRLPLPSSHEEQRRDAPTAPPPSPWLPRSTTTREGCPIQLHHCHRPSSMHLLTPPHPSPW